MALSLGQDLISEMGGAGKIDPKVFFSNERTYLKWLHTSVTLGSISSGLLGFNSILHGEERGNKWLRVVALALLLVAISFTAYALFTYQKRNRMLRMKQTNGYADLIAPLTLGLSVVVLMFTVYMTYIFQTIFFA